MEYDRLDRKGRIKVDGADGTPYWAYYNPQSGEIIIFTGGQAIEFFYNNFKSKSDLGKRMDERRFFHGLVMDSVRNGKIQIPAEILERARVGVEDKLVPTSDVYLAWKKVSDN